MRWMVSTVRARRPRIALVHTVGGLGRTGEGGGEGVFVHAIAELQHYCELHVLSTLFDFDNPAVWAARMLPYWGVDIEPEASAFYALGSQSELPRGERGQARLNIRQKVASLHARVRESVEPLRRLNFTPDLWVSTSNEFPIRGRVLQYVHYPRVYVRQWRPGPVLHRALSWAYGMRARNARAHATLANSFWTAAVCERVGLRGARVVYPPVTAPTSQSRWHTRRPEAVILGRLVPTKQVEVAILATAQLIKAGLLNRLHVIGPVQDSDYAQYLRSTTSDLMPGCVTFHGAKSRSETQALLSSVKFGIHAQHDEHFGMAPAEIAAAGCIPFVHDSGGQVEIVGGDPRLRFVDPTDLAAKLELVARKPHVQEELLRLLAATAPKFSVNRFGEELRAEVERLIGRPLETKR